MAEEKMFGWTDEIENDGNDQEMPVVIPEGEYDFKIVDFKREKSKSGANMAHLVMRVDTENGHSLIHEYIVLIKNQEWKISAFFRSIGQKKRGERVSMDWNKVLNAKGKAHVYIDTFTDNQGKERQSNKIDRYIDFAQANEDAIKFGDSIGATLLSDDDDMPF